MNQRVNDALSTLSTQETEEKPASGLDLVKKLLGGVAIAGIAGKLGGTPLVQATGQFFANRAAKEKQRRLEKINRAKQVLEAEQARSGIERDEQAVAESKARVQQAESNAEDTRKWRKDMAENQFYRDLGGNVQKVIGHFTKAITPGKSSGGGRGGGGLGGSGTLPKPPSVPMSADEEQKKAHERAYRDYGEKLAQNLIGTEPGKIRSVEELNQVMPQLLQVEEIARLLPIEREYVFQQLKTRAAAISNPGLAERTQQHRADPSKGGFEFPPPATMNTTQPTLAAGGAILGGMAGSAFGPVGTAAGAGFGGMVGSEIGAQFPDAFQMPSNVGPNTKADLADYIKRKYGPVSGSNVR